MTLPAALVEAVRGLGSGLAVFDADGTLWREDVGEAFLRHLIGLGWVKHSYEEYERRVDADKASGYAWAAQVQAGLARSRVDAEARRFARDWVPPRIVSATRELRELCVATGLTPLVVSASALPIVRAAAPLAGFEKCRGIETVVRDGRFTDELVEPVTYGRGKIVAAGGRIALACGDSFTGDLPMLEAARVSVVVAPGRGSPLADVARERGWPVLSQDD